MVPFLTREEIYEKIIPFELASEPGSGDDENDALRQRLEEMVIVIDEMEAELCDLADPERVEDTLDRFMDDLLAVAGQLIGHENVYLRGFGLKLAIIVLKREGDATMVRRIFDDYDQIVDDRLKKYAMDIEAAREEEAMAAEDAEDAIAISGAPSVPPLPSLAQVWKTANICLPRECGEGECEKGEHNPESRPAADELAQELRDYMVVLACDGVTAGLLLPPATPMGDRLHAQAVTAMHDVAFGVGFVSYWDIVNEYLSCCFDEATYPGAVEIFARSYEGVTRRLRQDCVFGKNSVADDLAVKLGQMLCIDSLIVANLYDLPGLRQYAIDNFIEHRRELEARDGDLARDRLAHIRRSYAAEVRGQEDIPEGIEKLFELIDGHRQNAAQPIPVRPENAAKPDLKGAVSYVALMYRNPPSSMSGPDFS